MPDLTDTIETAAEQPLSASTDAGSATGRSLTDLIAADKYLKADDGMSGTNQFGGPRSGWAALRVAKATPPGSV